MSISRAGFEMVNSEQMARQSHRKHVLRLLLRIALYTVFEFRWQKEDFHVQFKLN